MFRIGHLPINKSEVLLLELTCRVVCCHMMTINGVSEHTLPGWTGETAHRVNVVHLIFEAGHVEV
jgi:hypothetical protein